MLPDEKDVAAEIIRLLPSAYSVDKSFRLKVNKIIRKAMHHTYMHALNLGKEVVLSNQGPGIGKVIEFANKKYLVKLIDSKVI